MRLWIGVLLVAWEVNLSAKYFIEHYSSQGSHLNFVLGKLSIWYTVKETGRTRQLKLGFVPFFVCWKFKLMLNSSISELLGWGSRLALILFWTPALYIIQLPLKLYSVLLNYSDPQCYVYCEIKPLIMELCWTLTT